TINLFSTNNLCLTVGYSTVGKDGTSFNFIFSPHLVVNKEHLKNCKILSTHRPLLIVQNTTRIFEYYVLNVSSPTLLYRFWGVQWPSTYC
uniref:Uncharacterized protein n=1 Tax=Ciona intestinalis TaxID=7719 RepID=H2XZT1_CIOIN